jgi:CspA family cold shock protein
LVKGRQSVGIKLSIFKLKTEWKIASINKFVTFYPKTLYLHFINTIQYKKMDKQQGTVKFFNSEKGFGFIKHNDSNKETFVHVSGLISDIKEGDSVEFDLQEGKKGMNAVNVQVVG